MKFNKYIEETTTTADVEVNTAKGAVDIINKDEECPEGYIWCPEKGKCVKRGSGDGMGIRSFFVGRNK
jgi:hypothetical protein